MASYVGSRLCLSCLTLGLPFGFRTRVVLDPACLFRLALGLSLGRDVNLLLGSPLCLFGLALRLALGCRARVGFGPACLCRLALGRDANLLLGSPLCLFGPPLRLPFGCRACVGGGAACPFLAQCLSFDIQASLLLNLPEWHLSLAPRLSLRCGDDRALAAPTPHPHPNRHDGENEKRESNSTDGEKPTHVGDFPLL